jgi:Pre-PUA-like domain
MVSDSLYQRNRRQLTLEESCRGRESMFKKPPNIKNLSVLRSSDRKKIIQQIIQSYNLQGIIDTEDKNTLLPDGAQVE